MEKVRREVFILVLVGEDFMMLHGECSEQFALLWRCLLNIVFGAVLAYMHDVLCKMLQCTTRYYIETQVFWLTDLRMSRFNGIMNCYEKVDYCVKFGDL